MTAPIGGVDWFTVQKALRAWVVGGTGLPLSSVYWGGQDAERVAEPAVELSIFGETQVTEPWLDRESAPLVVSSKVVTAIDTTTDTLTVPSHGLVTGDGPLRFASTGAMPGNLPADAWVVVTGPSTLMVCDDYRKTGGNFPGNPITTLDITSTGSGTITLSSTGQTRRAGHEIDYVARSNGRCTLSLDCHTSDAVGIGMAMAVLSGVAARRPLPSQQAILRAANVGVEQVDRIRSIKGVRNAVMFEPRATMLIHFSVPSEVREPGTVIRYIRGTNLITRRPFGAP